MNQRQKGTQAVLTGKHTPGRSSLRAVSVLNRLTALGKGLFFSFMGGLSWVGDLLSAPAQNGEVIAQANPPPVEPIDLMGHGIEVAGYLVVLVAISIVVVRLGKRFQPSMGGGSLIRVEDGRNLAPGVGVRLIRVGSRAWLVGVTRERVSLLAEMSEEELKSTKEGVL